MASNPDQLLEKARQFDQKALAEIYDLFSDPLYAYAYKHVGKPQIAEDLVAETFQRFLTALERGGGPNDHLQAYLYRITHNLITDLYRREPPPALELNEGLIADENPGPAGQVSQLQQTERVRLALRMLTPEQRQVVVLRFLEGWTTQEIARSMDKSLGAVKALQHRGVASLQRILVDHQDPEPGQEDSQDS
jgi:RNA polymerase sigma-70 factor (ECF subfamily)